MYYIHTQVYIHIYPSPPYMIIQRKQEQNVNPPQYSQTEFTQQQQKNGTERKVL